MICSEFKSIIKDYLNGRLSGSKEAEFREHLLSCESCRRDMGEDIADIISKEQVYPYHKTKEYNNKYVIFFVAFLLLVFLLLISMQYIKIREYSGTEIKPLTDETKNRLLNSQKDKKISPSEAQRDLHTEKKDRFEQDVEDTEEDFLKYSNSELNDKLIACKSEKNYSCISKVSLYLAKKNEDEKRRLYRLIGIEALVELSQCSAAMLQIMLLLKENPSISEINRAHFLNAKCYFKEKNYQEAEKILSKIEKDAKDLKEEILKLREEIKKGERDGE